MRIAKVPLLRSLLLPCLLAAVPGCDRPAEEPQAENPPVAVWRPDSARVESSAADSLEAAPDDSIGEQGDPGLDNGDSDPAPAPAGLGGVPSPAPAPDTAIGAPPSTSPTDPAAAGEAEAEAVLLRAEAAYEGVRTLQADFVQDLTVPLLSSTQRSRGEIFHRKPDLFLMRFSDPDGDIVVADGRYLWLYYPSTDPKQVVRTSMGQAGRLDLQREFLSNPTERFNATLDGSETVAGRAAHVLTLMPKGQSPYRQVRLWIDSRDALARRFEITENNDAVRTVELRNLQVNEDLADGLFSFTPPPGTEVFDQ